MGPCLPAPVGLRDELHGTGAMRLRGGRMKSEPAGKMKVKQQRSTHDQQRASAGFLSSAGVSKKPRARGTVRKIKASRRQRQEQRRGQEEDSSPRIVALIPVSQSASADAAIDRLLSACLSLGDAQSLPSAQAADKAGPSRANPVTLRLPASCGGPARGGRVMLLRVDVRNSEAMLDALKVADCAVLVHHGAELPAPSCAITSPAEMKTDTDKLGGLAVACLRAQGLPALVVTAATHTAVLSAKVRHTARKARARLLHSEGMGEESTLRTYELDEPQQAAALLRTICTRALGGPAWRAAYSYLLASAASFKELPAPAVDAITPNDASGKTEQEERRGELWLEGYVRAQPLSANQLIHITGVGSFKMRAIHLLPDPCPIKSLRPFQIAGGTGNREESMEDDGDEEQCKAGPTVVSVRNESVAHVLDSDVAPEDVEPSEVEEEAWHEQGQKGAALGAKASFNGGHEAVVGEGGQDQGVGAKTREALGFGGLAGGVTGSYGYCEGTPLGALPRVSSEGGGMLLEEGRGEDSDDAEMRERMNPRPLEIGERRDEVMAAASARRQVLKRRHFGVAGTELGESAEKAEVGLNSSPSHEELQRCEDRLENGQVFKETEEARSKREELERRLRMMRTERRLRGMSHGTEKKEVHQPIIHTQAAAECNKSACECCRVCLCIALVTVVVAITASFGNGRDDVLGGVSLADASSRCSSA